MKIMVKDGKGHLHDFFLKEETINEAMEILKDRHICTNCYAQNCKLDGITIEKRRVTRGVETQDKVIVLSCRDHHVLTDMRMQPSKESQLDKQAQHLRDRAFYGQDRARIIHPTVAKSFNNMK